MPDPSATVALPEGFTYRVLAYRGMALDDGLTLPAMADAAACFPLGGCGPWRCANRRGMTRGTGWCR